MKQKRPWAVILAGGDGTRLQPLTRLISHDDRPKQFCPIFGRNTLLAQTRARLAHAIAPGQTVYAVVKAHERFYESELAGVRPSRIVVQPANRGTAAAIIYALMRILRSDNEATVGFFPADHYYADDAPFVSAVESAVQIVQEHSESLVLLGAEAQHAEVEYGWIEPGRDLKNRLGHSVFRVNRFWEKPSLQVARRLLNLNCLWNTFVMFGRAKTFFDALNLTVPKMLATFKPALQQPGGRLEMRWAERLYRTLWSSDFSEQVLSACTDRLAVLRLKGVEWSDLGRPERVIATMSRAKIPCQWLEAARVDGSHVA